MLAISGMLYLSVVYGFPVTVACTWISVYIC